MEQAMTTSEKQLLGLIKAALTGEGAPTGVDPAQILPLSEAHAVTPLLYDLLCPAAGDAPGTPVEEQIRRRTTGCIRQYYRLLFLTRYYVELLGKAGVPTVVLKGAGVSAHYPVPEYRKSGDVDLLLLNREDLGRAQAVLEGAGARREGEQHANHHMAFVGPDGIELELHLTITEDFDDRQANQCMAGVATTLEGHVVETQILPGVALPVLTDGYQAFTLLLHMLHHFLRSGFGLRLLCDWAVFWNRPVAGEELEGYLSLVRECGLEGFSRLITLTCVNYLGLGEGCAALLLAGGSPLSPETCAAFLREVFDAQEFGKTSSDRMVTLRGGGIIGYIREFHHQMCLNYPRAGKVFLLWPILWMLTLIRFLYNNHAVRKTSLFSILRTTGHRSRFVKELRLFQRD